MAAKSGLIPILPQDVWKYENDPESVGMELTSLPLQFGITRDELLGELRSGRLRASGTEVKGGYKDLFVSVAALARWMCRDDLPPGMAERILTVVRGTPRFQS
jgi:hypothetical protein